MDMIETVVYLGTALCLLSVPVMEYLDTRAYRHQQRRARRAQVFVLPMRAAKPEPQPVELRKAA